MNRYLQNGEILQPQSVASIHDTVPHRAFSARYKESLRDNWRLGLLVALIVLIIGVPLSFMKGHKFYGTSAVVHVNPRFLRNLTEDVEQEFQSNSQYRQYVQQQVSIMGRLDIAYETLVRLGDIQSTRNADRHQLQLAPHSFLTTLKIKLGLLPPEPLAPALPPPHYVWRYPGESADSAAWRLLMSVHPMPVPDTYLISVSIDADHSQNLALVLNTFVNAYLDRSRAEEFYGMDARLDSLTNRQKELEGMISVNLAKRSQLAQELGVTTFTDSSLNPFDALIIDGTRALDEARRKRLLEDSKVTVYVDKGESTILDAMANDQVSKDYGINALKANLSKRRGDLIAQISGLELTHPLYKAVMLELSEIDHEIAVQSNLVGQQQRKILKETYLAGDEQAKLLEEKMMAELTGMRSRASWYAEHYQTALKQQDEVTRYRNELEKIDERMGTLRLESKAPGFVHWSSLAVQDDTPLGGGKKKWLLMTLLAASAAFLAIPMLILSIDRRVKEPRDLHRLLGVAPMGWLVHKADKRLDDYAEDLLLRLAIRLNKDVEVFHTKSFALMGAKNEVGVTPLIFDLARVLRQMHMRVAIVELDAIVRAKCYQKLDDTRSVNALLNAVLIGQRPTVAPADYQVWTLDMSYRSKKVPNLGGLRTALQLIGQSVDIILIDSSPLLISADAELIAAEVDCAIMVARAGHSLSNDIVRAANLLERASPPAVGFLMTEVRVDGMHGYLVDDARERMGLSAKLGILPSLKVILADPVLLSVMIDSWWLTNRDHGWRRFLRNVTDWFYKRFFRRK